MPLPKITANMVFDTVLKAIETVLAAEALNQVALSGTGWVTVRERFDPWNEKVDKFNPGVANIVWDLSSFPDSEGNQFDMTSLSTFAIDCYASQTALESGAVILPKDQRAADVLHTLITKVAYTILSPINIDMGLTPGLIVKPWIPDIRKFIPAEANVPVDGVIAARISCRTKFKEVPPQAEGVALEEINVKSDTSDHGLVDQTFDVKP